MSLFQIAWANLRSNPLSTFLSVLLLSLGVATILFVLEISRQLNDGLSKDIRGIDMVVGAKGSPLQLILSAVYQMDSPTGNIPLEEAEKLSKHPMVKNTIPLAYGDSYKGFRIVGTEPSYIEHYEGVFNDGAAWRKDMEVVVGYKVATELSLAVGSHFHGSHGFDDHGHVHEEDAYHVSGVLEPTGSVIDRLILSNISSVWRIHSNHEGRAQDAPKEITAMLIKYKSPMAMMQLPRIVNTRTSMQAALPAIEINRLYSLLGVGFQTVRIIGFVMLIVSAISVFISLLSSLKERRFELALLRCLGGAPVQISSLLIFESLILCLIGWLVGVVLSKAAIWTAANYSDQEIGFSISNSVINTNDVLMLGVALLIGLMASVLPAFQAYGTNISKTLRSD